MIRQTGPEVRTDKNILPVTKARPSILGLTNCVAHSTSFLTLQAWANLKKILNITKIIA